MDKKKIKNRILKQVKKNVSLKEELTELDDYEKELIDLRKKHERDN